MLPDMEGDTYIKERQRQWAIRHDIQLIGSRPPRGKKLYTPTLDLNLFQPLSGTAQEQIAAGDGNELGRGDGIPGKMQALHSSSALAANVFDYWLNGRDLRVITKALIGSEAKCECIRLESKWPICPRFRYAPNIDVVFDHPSAAACKVTAVECKYCEPYGGRKHKGLDQKYLTLKGVWDQLPALRKLAERVSPDDHVFDRLDAAQLIKHVLGLQCGHGKTGFRLLCCWYNVPAPEGEKHRQELDAFRTIAEKDGIDFRAITYQELILNLAAITGSEHREYVNYLSGRYL